MSIYFVALNEPSETAWGALKEKWPGRRHDILNEHLALVAPEKQEELLMTEDICLALGIDIRGQSEGHCYGGW